MLNRLFRAMIVPMFVFAVALPVAAQEVTPEPPTPRLSSRLKRVSI